jgi:hypothetical protein
MPNTESGVVQTEACERSERLVKIDPLLYRDGIRSWRRTLEVRSFIGPLGREYSTKPTGTCPATFAGLRMGN